MVSQIIETIPIETLKEEMVAMVKEEMPFMEMIEAVSTPSKEEPKAKVEETTTEKKAPGPTEPGPPKEMASAPQTSKEEASVVEEKNEPEQNKESKEEEPSSKATATSTVSKQGIPNKKKYNRKKLLSLS